MIVVTLGETVGLGPRYGDFWDSGNAIFFFFLSDRW